MLFPVVSEFRLSQSIVRAMTLIGSQVDALDSIHGPAGMRGACQSVERPGFRLHYPDRRAPGDALSLSAPPAPALSVPRSLLERFSF